MFAEIVKNWAGQQGVFWQLDFGTVFVVAGGTGVRAGLLKNNS
jgi:hypothetical protein